MKGKGEPRRTIVQLTSTPHGLAARIDDGEGGLIIWWNGIQWANITPRFDESGHLIPWISS